MEAIIKQALAKMSRSVKTAVKWQPDQPSKQAYHSFDHGRWTTYRPSSDHRTFSHIALYSWNIDFMLPFPDSRMLQALKHLQEQVSRQDSTLATVIFLQECLSTDIDLIAHHPWVQEHFLLSDLDTENWSSDHYGTLTLVDRRLGVVEAFRLHYSSTRMQRDAFFTDVQMGKGKLVRLGNSHLESMAFMPPMRPEQVALAAQYMHKADGAVIAGDFNAIQDFDRTLHTENGLKDAYLELGGAEDSEAGYTWGQQASTSLRQQFDLCRMDKVFFCGALKLHSFERFGADVLVESPDERKTITELGFDEAWITDHLGVKAVFEIYENVEQKL